MSSLSICAILLLFFIFLPTVYVVNKQCILYTAFSDARRSAGGGAALRDVTGRGGDDVIDDVSGRCDVICTETWRRRSSADRRRVSAITSTLSTRMTSGTTPNISSSVTHDHTDQSDALPPSVTCHTIRLNVIVVFNRISLCNRRAHGALCLHYDVIVAATSAPRTLYCALR